MLTTVKYDELLQEIDYAKTLTKTPIEIFELVIKELENNDELSKLNDKYLDNGTILDEKIKDTSEYAFSRLPKYYENKASVSVNKNNEIEDELNNIDAYNAILNAYLDRENLKNIQIEFEKYIKQIHKKAKFKNPGKYRETKEEDVIIRSSEYEILPFEMKDIKKKLKELNKLIIYPTKTEYILIKAIIIHIYFEAIHPFCDGNGRIGRMILNTYINIYASCEIYLDEQINNYRSEYYSNLLSFCKDEKYTKSIMWFINIAIKAQEKENVELEQMEEKYNNYITILSNEEMPLNIRNNTYIIAKCLVLNENIVESLKEELKHVYRDNKSINNVINFLTEHELIN